MSRALMAYWRELPRRDVADRRRALDAIRARVLAGELAERAFATIALGDDDDGLVAAAAAEYVGRHPVRVEWREAAIEDALQWIRRGLPLNRGAVFAALLGLNDAVVDARLGSLRLALQHHELATVCRHAVARPTPAVREFLGEWLRLLEASETPDRVAQGLIARALQA